MFVDVYTLFKLLFYSYRKSNEFTFYSGWNGSSTAVWICIKSLFYKTNWELIFQWQWVLPWNNPTFTFLLQWGKYTGILCMLNRDRILCNLRDFLLNIEDARSSAVVKPGERLVDCDRWSQSALKEPARIQWDSELSVEQDKNRIHSIETPGRCCNITG